MLGARILVAAMVAALVPVLAAAQAPAAPVAPPAPAPAAQAAAKPPAPRPQLSESVAAVVNDDAISTYDLRQRMRLLAFSSGAQLTEQTAPEIAREALRGLVDERLQAQEIKRTEDRQKGFKITPTPREIDEDVAAIAKQFNVTPANFIRSLTAAGIDPKTLRDQVSASAAWRRYIQGRYSDNIHIGDDQITSILEAVAANASKPQYLVGEIFLDASRAGGQPQAEEGAKQLVTQIRSGAAPFSAVARQFSALPTAANGGDAGWLVSGQVQPELEKALEALRPGQVTDPIPVQDGVYILQLRDRRAGAGATLVSLKQAAVRLAPDADPATVADAQARLAAVKAAAQDCKNLETEASKTPGVVAGDLGEANLDELNPEFRAVVEPLKSGDIGGPVRTSAGLQLVGVCSRRSGGSQQPTRTDVENRIYGEQLDMLARRFLRDLRNSAAVDTR